MTDFGRFLKAKKMERDEAIYLRIIQKIYQQHASSRDDDKRVDGMYQCLEAQHAAGHRSLPKHALSLMYHVLEK